MSNVIPFERAQKWHLSTGRVVQAHNGGVHLILPTQEGDEMECWLDEREALARASRLLEAVELAGEIVVSARAAIGRRQLDTEGAELKAFLESHQCPVCTRREIHGGEQ